MDYLERIKKMNTTPIYQVDAFSTKPFAGNPAGVCLLNEPKPDEWMDSVAAEMNLAETAFLLPEGEGYRLRWFTPKVEVNLCGHATLASAHVLWESGLEDKNKKLSFFTRSGELNTLYKDGWIEMDFPTTAVKKINSLPDMEKALGAKPLFIGENEDYLVEMENEEIVRGLNPDFSLISGFPVRGVIVTSRGSAEYDFISRFFAPQVGINEDPVTGSAHCRLAPYWSERLGKKEMKAYQASARGGEILVNYQGERTLLSGQACIVFKGELFS